MTMVHHGVDSRGRAVDSKGRLVVPSSRRSRADIATLVKQVVVQVQETCRPKTVAEEVEQELTKPGHQGVGAVVNEVTGAVATFAAPVSYFSERPKQAYGSPGA